MLDTYMNLPSIILFIYIDYHCMNVYTENNNLSIKEHERW